MGITIFFYLFAFILTFLIIVIPCFVAGVLWSQWKYNKYIREIGCPFKHACLHYDSIETKEAIKRVLTLMLDNKVPVKEIKDIISQSIK